MKEPEKLYFKCPNCEQMLEIVMHCEYKEERDKLQDQMDKMFKEYMDR